MPENLNSLFSGKSALLKMMQNHPLLVPEKKQSRSYAANWSDTESH
jgi:hypothetical protein